jgi:hypothetical protein
MMFYHGKNTTLPVLCQGISFAGVADDSRNAYFSYDW